MNNVITHTRYNATHKFNFNKRAVKSKKVKTYDIDEFIDDNGDEECTYSIIEKTVFYVACPICKEEIWLYTEGKKRLRVGLTEEQKDAYLATSDI